MRKVFLVTGAGGFLGGCLLSYLSRHFSGETIWAVIRNKKQKPAGAKGIRFIEGDLKSEKIWRQLPRDITHVFHLAARIPYGLESAAQAETVTDNLVPVLRLLEAASHWKQLRQVIYSSSVSVYGTRPEKVRENSSTQSAGPYGYSKQAGEEVLQGLQSRRVAVACLRFSSLYGPGQYPGTVLPLMVRAAVEKKEIQVYGQGKRAQDFLFCEDAVRALAIAYQKKADGVFNIGSGQAATMKELAQTINRVFAAGRAKIHFLRSQSEGDAGHKISIRKAQKELGFYPQVSLAEGLQKLQKEMIS